MPLRFKICCLAVLVAGLMATLAMPQGAEAETFLADQGVQNWVIR